MRAHIAVPATLLALAALAVPAAAQDDCTVEAMPCPWVVAVDANGFVGPTSWTFTQDEWHELTVSNLDEVGHTVTLSTYGTTVTVPADADGTAVIQFTQAGSFTLTDMPSGKTATLVITSGDSVEAQNSSTGATSKGGPGFAMPLALLAVAGVAILMVRRQK